MLSADLLPDIAGLLGEQVIIAVPLWLWWWGPDLPDLETIWRVYVARFSIEHTFRFFKQVLKVISTKPRMVRISLASL